MLFITVSACLNLVIFCNVSFSFSYLLVCITIKQKKNSLRYVYVKRVN